MATPENAEDKDVNEMVHKKRHPLRAASTYGKVSVISLECSGHHVDIILPLAMHSIQSAHKLRVTHNWMPPSYFESECRPQT